MTSTRFLAGVTTDTMHVVLAMVTVLLMLLVIGFGAAAFVTVEVSDTGGGIVPRVIARRGNRSNQDRVDPDPSFLLFVIPAHEGI